MGELRYEPVKKQIDGVKESTEEKKLKNRARMLGQLSRMFGRNQRRTKVQRDLITKC